VEVAKSAEEMREPQETRCPASTRLFLLQSFEKFKHAARLRGHKHIFVVRVKLKTAREIDGTIVPRYKLSNMTLKLVCVIRRCKLCGKVTGLAASCGCDKRK
jgi:hypothetical protein